MCFYTLYIGACSKGMLKGRGRSWERPRPLHCLVCRHGWQLIFLCGFAPVVFAECHLHRVVQCFAHHGDGGVGGGLSAYGGKILRQGLPGSSTMRSPSVVEREERMKPGTMVTANPALTRLEFVIMSLAL